MELRHARHRKYKGQWVWPGDPVEYYTDAQAKAMVACGQAYWDKTDEVYEDYYPYHVGGGHYKLSNGDTVKGKDAAQQAEDQL